MKTAPLKRSSPQFNTDYSDGSLSQMIRSAALHLALITFVLGAGTLGYMTIEDWNFLDSLYMTVITVATIGFSEVHPLSDSGRIFTIVLIILGVGLVTVLFTSIAQKVFQRQLMWTLRGKRMNDVIKSISSHVIICGYGRLAQFAADDLNESGLPFVIIERDPDKGSLARRKGYLVVEGDASEEQILRDAGISRARQIASLLPRDSDNLYVILAAREISADIFILCRSEDEAGEKRLLKVGANKVLSPYRVGGQKIAESVKRPHVTDFLDLAVSRNGESLQIEEIKIPVESPISGHTLGELDLRQKANVILAAIIDNTGDTIFNPSADTLVKQGSTLIAFGLKSELIKLEALITR